jgi:hypothetical protein
MQVDKDAQLGMPFGTAANKLRKNLLFSLAEKLGLTVCFRCGYKINSPAELSIDHKVDWLHQGPELFWDLENVAFSHRVCNTRSGPKERAIAPPGHCIGCQLPKKLLPRKRWCHSCYNEHQKEVMTLRRKHKKLDDGSKF